MNRWIILIEQKGGAMMFLQYIHQLWSRSDGECKFWFWFGKVFVMIGVLFSWIAQDVTCGMLFCIPASACYFLSFVSFMAFAQPSE